MSETETTTVAPEDRLTAILERFADRVESVRIERSVGDRRVEETVYLRPSPAYSIPADLTES